MRALLSVVVASVEIEIIPSRHTVAASGNVGMIRTAGGRKCVQFDLTTALRCMSSLAVQSSDMSHTALADLFETRMKPRVSSMMTQGHSVATAFESLSANASWLTGETELRATLGSGGGSGTQQPAPAQTPPKKAAEEASNLRLELKKATSEIAKQTKLFSDQKSKSDRLERKLNEARRSHRPYPDDRFRGDRDDGSPDRRDRGRSQTVRFRE